MLESGNVQDEEHYSAATAAIVFFLFSVASGIGKLQSRESILASSPGICAAISSSSASGSLSVFCHRLHRLFLVDSGADISVYPASVKERRYPLGSLLTAANGTNIQTFGTTFGRLVFLVCK